LRLSKRLIREGQTAPSRQTLELDAAYQVACHQTQDHAEAMAAILERRKPVFTRA
jgi:hypothetical protein